MLTSSIEEGIWLKTFMAKPEEVTRKWYVVDAEGQTLGRLASSVAAILRGKHKPTFTPGVDTGDHVIIINASKIELTGNKLEQKMKYSHSLYPGGLKTVPYGELLRKYPERTLRDSIAGMLPHNTLGRQMIKKLKVYRGSEHPHEAQKPEPLKLEL